MGLKDQKEEILSPFEKLKKFFKSAAVRNTFAFILLIASVLCMFLLDERNEFRNEHLSFLNSNFIASIVEAFSIKRFNLMKSTWYLFLCLFFLIILCVFGGIFSKFFVGEEVEEPTEEEKKARKKRSIIYYSILIVIGIAIIVVFGLLGAFSDFNKDTVGLFLNLIYSVLITAGFFIIVPLILFLLYFIIRTIVVLIKKPKDKKEEK